jgi:hypothetical protein
MMSKTTHLPAVAFCLAASMVVADERPSSNASPTNLVFRVSDQGSGIVVGALPDRKSLEAWWKGETVGAKKLWWAWAQGPNTEVQPRAVITAIAVRDEVVHVTLDTGEVILLELGTGRRVRSGN